MVESVKIDIGGNTASPEIDLIETAYMPEDKLTRGELAEMRLKLELRQVSDWNEKVKNRNKRELRLLED
jgi:hypothetical protein